MSCFHGTYTKIHTALNTYLHPSVGTNDVHIFLWGGCDLYRLSSCYDICLFGGKSMLIPAGWGSRDWFVAKKVSEK